MSSMAIGLFAECSADEHGGAGSLNASKYLSMGSTPRIDPVVRQPGYGFVVTAPGRVCDFVSRFFAPQVGVPEDPMTDSTHCALIPYWRRRLGKPKLFAKQLSTRGGELSCENAGDRVSICGECALYLRGEIQF